jgi:surface polysaccharide O-acyltransferase-like enzyme
MYDKADKKYFAYLFFLVLVFTFGNQLLGELLNIAGYILDSDTLSHTRFLELPWFNPFSFDYSFSLVYFLAGGWLAKNKNLVPLKAGQAIIIVIVCALSISLFGIMKTSIDGMRYDTVWNGYDSILTLVMSSVMFLSISRISAPSKTLTYLASFVSSNTLGIYLLHIPLFFALSLKYSTLGMSDYFLCDLVFAFLVMSGSLLVSWFLSKVPFARRIVQV